MSFEDNKENKDQLSDVIIYTKSKKNSSQSVSSNSYSRKGGSKASLSKKIVSKEKRESDIKSISSFKNSINSNIPLDSGKKNLKKMKSDIQTVKSKKESGLTSNDDKEQSEDANDMNCRQMIKRFFENNNKINYVQTVTYFISLATFVFYVVCTYINKLFKYLNYIDYGVCPVYMIAHVINFLVAHQPLNYLISGDSIIFFILEIPPLFSSLCPNFHLHWFYRFINFTRVMRIIKVVNN